jgi:hypothetical protein
METMSKFKVDDEIVRTKMNSEWAPMGFKSVVFNKVNDESNYYLDVRGDSQYVVDKNWELAKPKWTIYNNTLPWSQLSDKQKGKLLLGRHTKLRFTVGSYDFDNVLFEDASLIYKAIKPEQVKPEPTMAELFLIDWQDCLCVGGKQEQNMIAKGWTKPCK